MKKEDEQVVFAFRNYVDSVLVEGSERELLGQEPIPAGRLREAGRALVESAKGSEVSETAERLVGIVDDIAGYGTLVPDANADVADGPSLGDIVRTIGEFKDYFETGGLTLDVGSYKFNNKVVIDLCLGEARDFQVQDCPELVVFTKTVVDCTSDKIIGAATGHDGFFSRGWTNGKRSYSCLESLQKEGGRVWEKVNKKGDDWSDEPLERLEKIAWTRLFEESAGDKEKFKKEYALVCIADSYIHESSHIELDADDAEAELRTILYGSAPFEGLRAFYRWERLPHHQHYVREAETALKYLEKAGYTEELWRPVRPGSSVKAGEAELLLKEIAGKALGLLEKDLKIERNDEKAEADLVKGYQELVGRLKTKL